jgi:transcription elongation factor Elf1
MPIEALCPGGHKILCPDDRAGRTAKCPRCGAAFRIPGAPVSANIAPGGDGGSGTMLVAAPADSSAVNPLPANGQATSQPSNGPGSGDAIGATTTASGAAPPPIGSTGDELIVFLCPNGHKLNGPARLAGKTGQCPHCGARFEIPFPEEVERSDEYDGLADTVTEDPLKDYSIEQRAKARDDDEDMPLEVAHLFDAVRADTESNVVSRIAARSGKGPPGAGKGTPAQSSPPASSSRQVGRNSSSELHPLARLVARLWEEREHGGIIELHLSGGAILVPEWFEANLSGGIHGLFAAQAADGTVTMTVVPWDEVTRVVVRGVVGLPDGMFE